MKKLFVALSAIAAFTAPALAADMAAKAPMRAAPLPVASWTGCYIAGGGGYGLFDVESRQIDRVTGATVAFQGDTGGRGWMGQVGGGCDCQFAGSLGDWVIGILGGCALSDVR